MHRLLRGYIESPLDCSHLNAIVPFTLMSSQGRTFPPEEEAGQDSPALPCNRGRSMPPSPLLSVRARNGRPRIELGAFTPTASSSIETHNDGRQFNQVC